MNQIPFFVLIFVESSYENKEEVDNDYSSVYILLLNHSLLILSKYVLKLQARKPFYYCPLHETLGMNKYKIFGGTCYYIILAYALPYALALMYYLIQLHVL